MRRDRQAKNYTNVSRQTGKNRSTETQEVKLTKKKISTYIDRNIWAEAEKAQKRKQIQKKKQNTYRHRHRIVTENKAGAEKRKEYIQTKRRKRHRKGGEHRTKRNSYRQRDGKGTERDKNIHIQARETKQTEYRKIEKDTRGQKHRDVSIKRTRQTDRRKERPGGSS